MTEIGSEPEAASHRMIADADVGTELMRPEDAGERQSKTIRRAAFQLVMERYALAVLLVVAIVVFSLLRPQTFPTFGEFTSIVGSQDVIAVLSIGLLFPLIAGEFDLSIGYVLGFTAMEIAILTGQDHMALWLAGVLTLATGAGVGAINALLVLRFRMNAFIATLGTGTVLQGLTLWISGGSVATGIPNALSTIGTAGIGTFPYLAIFAGLIAVVGYFVTDHTPFGRYLHATGAGREAANLAGVRTSSLLAIAFVMSGLLSAVAGIMQTAILGSANPDVGTQYMLPAFAAGFLGATAIRPGRFNVPGTILALALLAVGLAGLSQLGAPQWVAFVFDGMALIVAVALSVRRRSKLDARS